MKPRRALGSTRNYDPLCELVFARSQGDYVWDEHGNQYLDMICGYSACNLGHSHPRIAAAACQQLNELTWAHGGESLVRQRLEESIAQLWSSHAAINTTTTSHPKVWLTVSGARAIEIAWKLAHAKSPKPNQPSPVVCFDLAYHGRSLATALLSDTQRSNAIAPASPSAVTLTIPFPRHPRGTCGPILANAPAHDLCPECQSCLAHAHQTFKSLNAMGGILFVEPAIGARGYYFAPAAFMQSLTQMARENGFAVISDEIQMGLRRSGPMIMSRAQGWEPDLLVLGKSLGGGIAPIAAVVGEKDWIDSIEPGIESETFAAYPLACRIACETLDILSQDNLEQEIERKGRFFRTLLGSSLPETVVVDGVGLASSLNLERLTNHGIGPASAIVRWLSRHGVLVHLTGPKRNRIAMIPSLLMPEKNLQHAAEKIIAAFGNVA